MSPEANKAFVRHHVAALARGNVAVLGDHPGLHLVPPFCQLTLAAFGDGNATIHELVAEGDWVVARLTRHGTHQGVWMGIPATGERVAWDVIAMFQFANGKIMRVHRQADVIELMRQLSAPPELDTR